MFCPYDASSFAFTSTGTPRRAGVFVTTPRKARMSFLAKNSNSWNEEDLILRATSKFHDETEEEARESATAAAFDAHDCSDPRVEAVMEQRAHMMAQDMAHRLKEKALQQESVAESIKIKMENWSWNEEHMIHGAHEIHEETDAELRESEDAAAIDAHDCSDPGMEAAMEARAVMLAIEFAHKMKEQAKAKQNDDGKKY
jgi:hypothetical protein